MDSMVSFVSVCAFKNVLYHGVNFIQHTPRTTLQKHIPISDQITVFYKLSGLQAALVGYGTYMPLHVASF